MSATVGGAILCISMADSTETQLKTVVEQVPDRQLQREQDIDARFEKIEARLDNQPTKEEFNKAIEGLASKNDIALFNSYAHRFTLGVEILGKSSKWVLFAVITIGGLAGGLLFIKNGFIAAIALFGFTKQ
jgi:hypothetical protein